MKKVIFSVVFLGFIQATAIAQCLPEGITFTKQTQIDNFQTDYPGCTEIEGDVLINGVFINNLNGLSVLKSVGGLEIAGSKTLKNLEGLNSLTFIGGSLKIENVPLLSDITALINLDFIDGDLIIGSTYGNDQLSRLAGLDSLTFLGNDIKIVTSLRKFPGNQ